MEWSQSTPHRTYIFGGKLSHEEDLRSLGAHQFRFAELLRSFIGTKPAESATTLFCRTSRGMTLISSSFFFLHDRCQVARPYPKGLCAEAPTGRDSLEDHGCRSTGVKGTAVADQTVPTCFVPEAGRRSQDSIICASAILQELIR